MGSDQSVGIYVHGAKVTEWPTHGGLIPVHGKPLSNPSSPLTAPVLTWTSDNTTLNPVFDATQIQTGDNIDLQVSISNVFGTIYGEETGVLSPTDGLDGVHAASGIPTLANSTTYYARLAYTRGGVTSAWSNTASITTAAAAASTLVQGTGATGAGVNRSQWINSADGLTFAMNVDVGDCIMDRSVAVMPQKTHCEVTIGTLVAHVFAGVVDSSTALGAATVPGKPGSAAGPNGFAIDCNAGNTTCGVWANGTFTGVTLGSAPVAGDTIMWEYDSSAKTVLVKHKKAVGGTVTTLASITLTSKIPTTPTAFGGGWNNTDGGTYNFGGSAWVFAPTAGYSGM